MRRIKRLHITEVSAVDRPAVEGATALIMKNEEVKVAKLYKCPSCGHMSDTEDDFTKSSFSTNAFSKFAAAEKSQMLKSLDINKCYEDGKADLIKKMRDDNPRMSKDEAFAKVIETKEYSELMTDYRNAKAQSGLFY
jgi:hypothetical protein